MTVINSIDNDRRMRLRLKNIRSTTDFIIKSSKNIIIHLDSLNEIVKTQEKIKFY